MFGRRLLGILLIVLAVAYGYLRYSLLSMETSDLPSSLALPIVHEGETLMTFQNGDKDNFPVIFVHGTPGKADNWAYDILYPRPGYRVVAVDRPGFGESTPAEGLTTLEGQAAALRPLLEGFAGRGPILVGHSLGAPIVARAAVDFPELVGGIVLVAGSLSPSVEVVYTIQYVGNLPGIRLLLPRSLRNSNHELIPLRESLERLAPRLWDITCPVGIVHGTADMLVPFENVAYMESLFNSGVIRSKIVLEGENHFLPWTAHEKIWEAVEGLGETTPSK